MEAPSLQEQQGQHVVKCDISPGKVKDGIRELVPALLMGQWWPWQVWLGQIPAIPSNSASCELILTACPQQAGV